MQKWMEEDWEFTVTVKEGQAERCRLGFERNDSFTCGYETPSGFCPKTMPVLYTLCEIIRCGGSFMARGSDKDYEIDFRCADGPVQFRLSARKRTSEGNKGAWPLVTCGSMKGKDAEYKKMED